MPQQGQHQSTWWFFAEISKDSVSPSERLGADEALEGREAGEAGSGFDATGEKVGCGGAEAVGFEAPFTSFAATTTSTMAMMASDTITRSSTLFKLHPPYSSVRS